MQLQESHFEVLEETYVMCARAEEIRAIEDDILDLYEISTMINQMVDEQGEDIDLVVNTIEQSKDDVSKGTEHIKEAGGREQKNRNFWAKAGAIIIVITAVVIAILLI